MESTFGILRHGSPKRKKKANQIALKLAKLIRKGLEVIVLSGRYQRMLLINSSYKWSHEILCTSKWPKYSRRWNFFKFFLHFFLILVFSRINVSIYLFHISSNKWTNHNPLFPYCLFLLYNTICRQSNPIMLLSIDWFATVR